VLAPLEAEGRVGVVADRIREAIFLGIFTDGTPLPSEADLSAELGVSTKTLREALAALRQEGLIETRRGRAGGSFIRSRGTVSKRAVSQKLGALSISQLRDLSDEHRAIAGMAALLAATRADDDELARLLHLSKALDGRNAPAASGLIDSQFHIEVAVCSQSERLTRAEALLQRESRDLLWFAEVAVDVERISQEHAGIVEAISRQDADLARSLAEQHVVSNYRHLRDLRLTMRQR
jgi:DNA-binding FadR family transcriptional regulator